MIAAFTTAWILARHFAATGSLLYLPDHPNERSLHTDATSRSGGIAMLAGLCLGLVVALPNLPFSAFPTGVVVAVVAVGTVSLVDDVRGLSPGYRLLVHAAAATCVAWNGLVLGPLEVAGHHWSLPVVLSVVLTIVALVWSVNLYNFMDGMDGLAGGMAVVGFGTFALLGLLHGNEVFGLLAALVASAAGGFLVLNWAPAKIFMGDTGASVLGLLAGVLCIWGQRDEVFPFWIGLLVFSPFWVDATYTLIRRALRGDVVWRAHRDHCYQRLVRAGWSHRRATSCELLLMTAVSASAIYAVHAGPTGQAVLLVFWLLAYTALIAMVNRLESGAG